jgi:hypothetical protein
MHTPRESTTNATGGMPAIAFTGCELLGAAPARAETRTAAK